MALGIAFEKFLDRFETRLKDGKGFRVRCPAHDDQDPSLHIEESGDGTKVLVTCRAGCELKAVVQASGAQLQELYESHWTRNGSHEGRARTAAPGQGRPPFGKITATYDYHDERGALLFQVLRDEHKNFRQRRPKPGADPGEDQWTYDLTGVRRVLYKLDVIEPARLYRQRIYLVEGEKDANSIIDKLGLVATTPPQGAAAAWLPQYTDQLAGAREVVIIPDNDEPGKKHAAKVRDAIADWVESVKVLELPKLDEKGDVSDWIAAGGTKDELETLATAATPWITAEKRFTAVSISIDEFMVRSYPKPRSLLGDGLICAGDLVFFYGRPGLGKTWAMIQGFALKLAQGDGFFGLAPPDGGPIRVGILELELNAFFLQQRIRWIQEKEPPATNRKPIRIIARPSLRGAVDMLTEDYKALERWCREETLDLILIDALSRAHSANENQGHEFGPVLRRFDEISENTGTAIVAVHHEPKLPRDGKEIDDMDALRGSTRMQSDSKALIRLVGLKQPGLFALRFPKTNNAAPIAPIYLERPKNSGFVVTDAPQALKEQNVQAVQEALVGAGAAGLTDREVAGKTGLSEKTVKRHREVLGARATGEQVPQGEGKARRWVSRWRLTDTHGQVAVCPPDVTQPSLYRESE